MDERKSAAIRGVFCRKELLCRYLFQTAARAVSLSHSVIRSTAIPERGGDARRETPFRERNPAKSGILSATTLPVRNFRAHHPEIHFVGGDKEHSPLPTVSALLPRGIPFSGLESHSTTLRGSRFVKNGRDRSFGKATGSSNGFPVQHRDGNSPGKSGSSVAEKRFSYIRGISPPGYPKLNRGEYFTCSGSCSSTAESPVRRRKCYATPEQFPPRQPTSKRNSGEHSGNKKSTGITGF